MSDRRTYHRRALVSALFLLAAVGGAASLSLLGSCAPGAPAPTGRQAIVDASLPWSERIAKSFILRHPGNVTYDSLSPSKAWNYEQGLMLVALHRMWQHAGDRHYLAFVRGNMDHYVASDGFIRTYRRTEYNIDHIGPGRIAIVLHTDTGEERFRRAADTLRLQLREHPRTSEGGFWHKQIYPHQMWLDGLFMAQPFYALYAVTYGDTAAFADILRQFRLVTTHTRDPRTGLLYHGWDESRTQRWADPVTGRSPNFWSRSMGWYMMALVEVLDILPPDLAGREELLAMFRDAARAIAAVQDPASGLWWQVTDQAGREGNYLEASGSAMFCYAFARGAHRGYLDPSYAALARRAFDGLTGRLVTVTPEGYVDLQGVCKVAGLGGDPYRDGSYAYYISEPLRTNDMKGLGPFLLAAIELESGATPR